jgi:hypothetical protein
MSLQTVRAGGTDHFHEMLDFSANTSVLTGGIIDIPSGSFEVTEQATPDMSVKIALGKAYLPNADNSISFPIRNYSTPESVIITNNASGNDRIDAVVLYVDLSETPNADSSNVAKLVAIAGTPAASPSAPSDGDIESEIGAANPYIRLANVEVANGATSILDADILDKRNDREFYYDSDDGKGLLVANDPMTYNDVDKIDIPNDKTSIYRRGVKLKLTNDSTTKYFWIRKSTYSSGTNLTTITITGEVNLASGDITNQQISWKNPSDFKPFDFFSFNVYRTNNFSGISSGVATKIPITTKDFDYNGNYDEITNTRYDCPVNGRYRFDANAYLTATTGTVTSMRLQLYKNGSEIYSGQWIEITAPFREVTLSKEVTADKGDYFEIYILIQGTGTHTLGLGKAKTSFGGTLVGLQY